MDISISRQTFLDAVNKVKTVVAPRSALPILSHVLVETTPDGIQLTATDLKVSIECSASCTVHEPGSLTVSAGRLSSILAELPEGEVSFKLGENNVVSLSSGRIETRLFSMSPDEFPPLRSFEGIEPLVMEQGLLKDLFQKTSFAICTDQARYNLTGLLFQIEGGKLTVVATDGRRMSLCIQDENIPDGISIRVIIPSKMIHELERLLGDAGEVSIYIDETQAAFVFDSVRLVTALIDGTFPNYEMVLPKRHDKTILLERNMFFEAMRRTRTMTNEKFNNVRFIFEENNLILRVVTPDVGEYREELPIEYTHERLEIAFNPEFIAEVLRRIAASQVALVLRDSGSPGLLKGAAGDGEEDLKPDNYLNVIMPIRV